MICSVFQREQSDCQIFSMDYILPLHSCLHKGNHDLKLWRNVVADGSADTRTPGKLSNDDSEMARLRKVCYVAIVLAICASHASIDFGEVKFVILMSVTCG